MLCVLSWRINYDKLWNFLLWFCLFGLLFVSCIGIAVFGEVFFYDLVERISPSSMPIFQRPGFSLGVPHFL